MKGSGQASSKRSIEIEGQVQLSDIIKHIQNNTPDNAILCNGAGNTTSWLHRFYQFRQFRTQLAPTSGTMGYGLSAAIAAKLRYSERCVVALAGDGDFMMNGQEFATAMQYQANIIVVLVNNGIYGTIRMHQERDYPGRVIGTDMVNPDFVALAQAFGAHAELVRSTEEFEPAFKRSLKAEKLSLIEIQFDANILSPTLTIQGLRSRKG